MLSEMDCCPDLVMQLCTTLIQYCTFHLRTLPYFIELMNLDLQPISEVGKYFYPILQMGEIEA